MRSQTYNIIIRPPVRYYIIVSYIQLLVVNVYIIVAAHGVYTGVYCGGREWYIHLATHTLHNYV